MYFRYKNEFDINDRFNEIISQFGSIDILICAAGGSAREKHSNIISQDVSVIDEILTINLRGNILCARKAALNMSEKNMEKLFL